MRACEERSSTPVGGSGRGCGGVTEKVKDTGPEKLKCHQAAVLLGNTCGASLETHFSLCKSRHQRSKFVGGGGWRRWEG